MQDYFAKYCNVQLECFCNRKRLGLECAIFTFGLFKSLNSFHAHEVIIYSTFIYCCNCAMFGYNFLVILNAFFYEVLFFVSKNTRTITFWQVAITAINL